ncbi:MAG: hypothetical protein DRJ40_08505 [Thermoprotei archaeon]|nr:MAG: hypothetical protein DRJ40_08505 [Thermoprotei archaeon]
MSPPLLVTTGMYVGLIAGVVGTVLLLIFRRKLIEKMRLSYWASLSMLSLPLLLLLQYEAKLMYVLGLPISYFFGI